MSVESAPHGWVLTGFQAIVGLWAWIVLVLLHCVFRLWNRPQADPVRPSGPID